MNTNKSTVEGILDSSLRLRPVAWSDAEAIAQLIYDACAADGDAIVAVSAEELRHGWQSPGFNLEKDVLIVETSDGRVVGYDEITNDDGHAILNLDGSVHPEFKGRGIGTTLLNAIERRAHEIMLLAGPDARVVIVTTLNNKDQDGRALHLNEGYQPFKYHWRMEIVLDAPPKNPILPDGIEIRPFIKGVHDMAVWQADSEAFRDHPGSHEIPFKAWKRIRFDDPEFDPTLWAVAWDGDQVAGYSLNRYRTGIGWIRTIGVRRKWRKRGIGEALLLHSFGEYYRRGTMTIGLGVNAHNPTGATRLYQKVGMRPASEHTSYEKELRAGKGLVVESL